MKFEVIVLHKEHAKDWMKLQFNGARDYPLGFLICENDAKKITLERAEEIPSFGSLRGLFHQEKMIGFCGFRQENSERTRHRATVGPFYVATDYHGSGAAKTQMRTLINEALELGVEQLELFVDTENVQAIRFYEKLGFCRIGTHPDGVRIDGVARDQYFYCLQLNAQQGSTALEDAALNSSEVS